MVLEDGSTCWIQLCVEPGSHHTPEFLKQQIISALNSMSPQTRWLRFASSGDLTDAQLDYLTELDGKDRVAWCAAVRDNGKEIGVGLARYIRLVDEEDVAEYAITVVDKYQGQGIGAALLKKLIESARENDIKRLRGHVLAGNKRMLSLCKSFDADIRVEDTSFLIAEISLDAG